MSFIKSDTSDLQTQDQLEILSSSFVWKQLYKCGNKQHPSSHHSVKKSTASAKMLEKTFFLSKWSFWEGEVIRGMLRNRRKIRQSHSYLQMPYSTPPHVQPVHWPAAGHSMQLRGSCKSCMCGLVKLHNSLPHLLAAWHSMKLRGSCKSGEAQRLSGWGVSSGVYIACRLMHR